MTPAEQADKPPASERSPNVDYENVIDYRTLPAGKLLAVDLKQLVNRVVVAPEAPSWFIDVVRDIVSKYNQAFPVDSSAMLRRPRYNHIG
ncbi:MULTISPECIES: hypothetical protein [unclassified Arthrobacter]|uniref:hypothetical protein n=1 Tax=Pseudarthrobacter sp. S6 TaxID=3418420 RepID=UPI003397D4BB